MSQQGITATCALTVTKAPLRKDYLDTDCDSLLTYNTAFWLPASPESSRTQAWILIQTFIFLIKKYFFSLKFYKSRIIQKVRVEQHAQYLRNNHRAHWEISCLLNQTGQGQD